jgi:ABC-type uncharacterized transport system ATPase component
MLTLASLTVRLSNGQVLFDQLSHTFTSGERHIILGHNGTGKSTLLNLIAGLKWAESGTITWKHTDITRLMFYERSKRFLGVLFQQPSKGCIPLLTVRQNLQLASIKNRPFTIGTALDTATLERAFEYAEILHVPLRSLLDRPMMYLSGGQQQLIVCIMMLINTPELIVLDEPTAALSPHAVKCMRELLLQYHMQHASTLLCVTHDMSFSESLATMTHELHTNGTLGLVTGR